MSTETSQNSPSNSTVTTVTVVTKIIEITHKKVHKKLKLKSHLFHVVVNETEAPIPQLLAEIKSSVLKYKLEMVAIEEEATDMLINLAKDPSVLLGNEGIKEYLKILNTNTNIVESAAKNDLITAISSIFSSKNTDVDKFEAIQCLMMTI